MEPLDTYAERVARKIVGTDLSKCESNERGHTPAGDLIVSRHRDIPRRIAEEAVRWLRLELEHEATGGVVVTKLYTQRFRDSGDEFIAKGTNQNLMDVFEVQADGSEKLLPMKFPACLKFMTHAELVGDMEIEDA